MEGFLIAPGTHLGPYEIVSRIGAGGMGEVWKARDTRLDRSVAIKILPTEFANNPQLKARFEREARTISQLEHPHICRLYDVGEADVAQALLPVPDHAQTGVSVPRVSYLVMELLDGESLADSLARGPLPLTAVLTYGAQIAEALDKAHRQGVVHRDLKPGNIMITKSGAKLLDFGLAKMVLAAADPGAATLQLRASTQKPLTQEGTIVGTFQYMAPEQLEGEEADARTDIFALGSVLYEMTTGRRAFQAKTKTSLIAAIVDRDPTPVSEIQPLTPPSLEHVIAKCLEKDRDSRWQSAHDIADELRWIGEAGSQAGVAAPLAVRRKTREYLWIAACAGLAALAAFAAYRMVLQRAEIKQLSQPLRFSVFAPAGASISGSSGPQLSPDGKSVVFGARKEGVFHLWMRELDSAEARVIAGTEDGVFPFWAPDSQFIGFFANGKLKRVSIKGGDPQTLADVSIPRGGAWNSSGVIVFAPGSTGPLKRISASGGAVTNALDLDTSRKEIAHRWPHFLPDGKHFLFLSQEGRQGSVWVASLDSKEKKRLAETQAGATYAAGRLFFVRERSLLTQSFDARALELKGEPSPFGQELIVDPTVGLPPFSVTDHALVFRSGGGDDFQITWLDRSGKLIGKIGPLGSYDHVEISPDGRFAAMDRADGRSAARDVWLLDLIRGTMSRFTFGQAVNWIPVWSPDSRRIAFISDRDGEQNVFLKSATGNEPERKFVASTERQHHLDWSADGRYIAQERAQDIWVVDAQTGKARPFITSPFMEGFPRISPDSRWLAYASNESGRTEVYVQSFPDGGGKWQVSTIGGAGIRWRADGRELFYFNDGQIMAVTVDVRDGRLETGAPQSLFAVRSYNNHAWDVTADGHRFLIPIITEEAVSTPIQVVMNWQSTLN